MPRYNLRTLRGERVAKKKEGERMTKWKLQYERFVNDNRNVLSVEEVREKILFIHEDNAIEQTNISLLCPLSKERIVVPVRYRTCQHFQCFDLKAFLAMKAKRNFLECPICNAKISNELKGLCVDEYFQKILSEINNGTEAKILRDSTYSEVPAQLAFVSPKVIDDEEPYLDYSTTYIGGVKSEIGSDVNNVEGFDSRSSFYIKSETNESDIKTQNVPVPETYMADDADQAALSSIAEAGSKIEEKRFKCGDCSYSTNYKHNLLTHMRIHTFEKPFKCSQCSFASAQLGSLKAHIRTHNGEKPYKCSQCSYSSTGLSGMKAHMRTHTGEKPYKCTKCSSDFTTASHLNSHMRTHTGEKPHKCSKCSYASAQPGGLQRHSQIHTGEKPYKCTQCSYANARSGNLKSHMRTHTLERSLTNAAKVTTLVATKAI